MLCHVATVSYLTVYIKTILLFLTLKMNQNDWLLTNNQKVEYSGLKEKLRQSKKRFPLGETHDQMSALSKRAPNAYLMRNLISIWLLTFDFNSKVTNRNSNKFTNMKLSPIFALAANASILQFDYDQYEVQTVQARQRAKRTTDEETVANSYRKVFYFFCFFTFCSISNQLEISEIFSLTRQS